jgi:excisionase family DNA binding protein
MSAAPIARIFVSREEAAELLGVSVSTIDRLRAVGIIETHHVGSRVMVARTSLTAIAQPIPKPKTRADRMRERNVGTPSARAGTLIYFIEGAGKVKIGITQKVRRRLEEVQAMSPVEVRVVHVVPGTAVDENDLHRRFKEYWSHGEWFHKRGSLKAYLRVAIRLRASGTSDANIGDIGDSQAEQ